jgi:hypothetical protein
MARSRSRLVRLSMRALRRACLHVVVLGITTDSAGTAGAYRAATHPAPIGSSRRVAHAGLRIRLQFCGHCSDPDALTWHHLPSPHETTSDLSYATTTITVINHTAATMSGSDVELIPAGCAWIDGYWSTTVATLLANLDQVEQHRAGDDPHTLPFYPCGPHTHA